MKIRHHEREFGLSDEWWTEAGMADFFPTTSAYRTITGIPQIFTVSIKDIGPVSRPAIFKDNEEETARERVLSILRGFRRGEAFPAVDVVEGKRKYGHPFKLTHGAHRFYCSLAAGFTHIPAVKGFDVNDPSG